MTFLLRRIASMILLSIMILLVVMFFRAEVYFPHPHDVEQCNQTHEPISGQANLIDRFIRALRIKTITRGNRDYDRVALKEFAQFLHKNFPTIYSSKLVQVETVNNFSLLYSIKGNDPTLKPYLLCSHMDVVPVEVDKWSLDPFVGAIEDGYIYGRGSMDAKHTLMGIMESLEYLLKRGFVPRRPFYIAFGHDEEGQGVDGAQEIAKMFIRKGIKEFEYLLDEGTNIFTNESFFGIQQFVAVVGVGEKGYVSLNLKANGPVGHSSMAPIDTSITILGRAVSKLTGNVHQNFFGFGPEKDTIDAFARYSTYPYKLIYSNLWLFGPLISSYMSGVPALNAMIRTSTAMTIIKGGFKANVLPSSAEATVNHRIHPLQSVQDVIEFDRTLINDPNVDISISELAIEPHPISSCDSFGYRTIESSIGQVFGNTITIPGILIASTDVKWYLNFTRSIYRFSPIVHTPEDMKRFHGHNERISVENYLKLVNFFHHVMLNSDKKSRDSETIVKDEL